MLSEAGFDFELSNAVFEVDDLQGFLKNIKLVMPLINQLQNITFFVKDTEGNYVIANQNLVYRSQKRNVSELIGQKAEEVFGAVGEAFTNQDLEVMTNKPLINHLELHHYKSGLLGWCMATKIPLITSNGIVVGMVGMAIDLQDEKENRPKINSKLSKVEQYISQYFQNNITIEDLAHIANLSKSQLNRQFKNIFQMTPLQLIHKKRFDLAIFLLSQDISITDISLKCGYSDHSAFSRKFKELTQMSPSEFKEKVIKIRSVHDKKPSSQKMVNYSQMGLKIL